MAKSIADQSQTFPLMISEDFPSATSSPESADGPSPSDLPDGTMTDLFGQVHVPASHSAPPVRARRPMTDAICGLRGFLSSRSGALQSSLESRLRRRLDGAGSTLFALTWRAKGTPSGRPYCQLAASARLISETDFGSWATPRVSDQTAGRILNENGQRVSASGIYGANLSDQATLASWPTPMAGTPAQKGYNEAGNTDSGRKTVALTTWPTPQSRDGDHSRSGQVERTGGRRRNLDDYVTLTSWPTPRAEDSESSGMRHSRGVADTLTAVATLSTWATPTASDHKGAPSASAQYRKDGKFRNDRLDFQAAFSMASGTTPNGSTAPMEKPGQLSPAHSGWVMGYSQAHLDCAPTELPKSKRK